MENINNDQKSSEVLLDYKINNVVATVKLNLNKKLNLTKIARKLCNAEYYPERFPGVIHRQENPRATFLIFSTGKMVVTRIEIVEDVEKVVRKLMKKIKKIGIKPSNLIIVIENIVANGDLHTLINLNKAVLLMDFVMYEPEVFPGLIYNMKNPRAVFLLFSTGKFVCTGIKEKKNLKKAILKLKREINNIDITSEEVIEDEFELTFL
jgi:transcription initiation factor TFIID TATA-box-binding protein